MQREGYQLDASRCISYLTIEHRGPIRPEVHAAMGDWVAGCDVCQEVCPHNRETTTASRLRLRETDQPPHGSALDLLDVLGWNEDDRRQYFRGSALKRIKVDMLKRNALIAAGNHLRQHNAPPLRQRIAQLADDPHESELVRLTAQQVLRSLPDAVRSADL